jgi:hypothetical protein
MNRRNFLRLAAGAGVAAATMAEAGFWSEFLSWLKRKPVHSIPLNATITQYADFVSYTEASLLTSEKLLPELNLGSLATIYYDRKALDNLNTSIHIPAAIFNARPTLFSNGTKAVRFGKIWKPVIETKKGLLVV